VMSAVFLAIDTTVTCSNYRSVTSAIGGRR
jgi:hypothetical protein